MGLLVSITAFAYDGDSGSEGDAEWQQKFSSSIRLSIVSGVGACHNDEDDGIVL